MTNPPDPKPMTEEQHKLLADALTYGGNFWAELMANPELPKLLEGLLVSYDARGEALNSILGWIGQCQSDDYVDWLFDRNTPGFERWNTVKEAKDTLRSVVGKGWSSLASPPPVAGEGGRGPLEEALADHVTAMKETVIPAIDADAAPPSPQPQAGETK